ncbi:MAG: hypothetical protein CM15mP111_1150 [Hyphomicrobiales bacterium]|nr:MAG: hypothetical protein CM15mP111_1150 [Hyphomicrobiales bacterium]
MPTSRARVARKANYQPGVSTDVVAKAAQAESLALKRKCRHLDCSLVMDWASHS